LCRIVTTVDHMGVNRAHCDLWATAHGQDAYYGSAALVAGADSLTDVECSGLARAVGDVKDLDVLHVQCHRVFVGLPRPLGGGARETWCDLPKRPTG
jgi:hypothetical protein